MASYNEQMQALAKDYQFATGSVTYTLKDCLNAGGVGSLATSRVLSDLGSSFGTTRHSFSANALLIFLAIPKCSSALASFALTPSSAVRTPWSLACLVRQVISYPNLTTTRPEDAAAVLVSQREPGHAFHPTPARQALSRLLHGNRNVRQFPVPFGHELSLTTTVPAVTSFAVRPLHTRAMPQPALVSVARSPILHSALTLRLHVQPLSRLVRSAVRSSVDRSSGRCSLSMGEPEIRRRNHK